MPRRRLPIGTILFFLFATFTLLEIWLLFWLASVTSWLFTIALAILSAIVGSAMAKHEGLGVLARAKTDLAQGRFPAKPLADGVMILLGGALLITPGLITDLIGFTTLIAPCRRLYAKLLIGWVKKNVKFVNLGAGMAPGFDPFGAGFTPPQSGNGNVFDADPGSYRSSANHDPEIIDAEFQRRE